MIITSPDQTILHAHKWSKMTAEEIVDHLIEYNIDLFFPTDSLEKANESFKKLFLYNSSDNIEYKEAQWSKNLYRHESRRGSVFTQSKFSNAASNHFLEYHRLRAVNRLTGFSPVESYHDRDQCIRVISHLKKIHPQDQPITSRIIRKYINKIFPESPQFPPLLAKHIIDRYCVKDGSVLDLNCEWGDRLVGFYASHAQHYTGLFNSPENLLDLPSLVVKYMEMIDHFSLIGRDDKDIDLLFNECNQRFTLSRPIKKHNLIFTSLNAEYKIPKVLYNLLNPKLLKDRGYIVVHLDDFRQNRKRVHLVRDLVNLINRYPNLVRIPPIGKQSDRGIEPIWIWRKK